MKEKINELYKQFKEQQWKFGNEPQVFDRDREVMTFIYWLMTDQDA